MRFSHPPAWPVPCMSASAPNVGNAAAATASIIQVSLFIRYLPFRAVISIRPQVGGSFPSSLRDKGSDVGDHIGDVPLRKRRFPGRHEPTLAGRGTALG